MAGERKSGTDALRKWSVMLRVWSFAVDIVPVTLGTALALPAFNPVFYVLMLIGTVSLNAFANVANDIYDFAGGTDSSEDKALALRGQPLLSGMATMREMVGTSIALVSMAALCGLYIAAYRGAIVIAIGLVGTAIAFVYTAGRHSIKRLGIGEPFVLLAFGPLMTGSAYFVESGGINGVALAASLLVGILVMLVLLANNIRDIDADSKNEVRTMAVKIGKGAASGIFSALLAFDYLLLMGLVGVGALTPYALAGLASAPYAMKINKAMHGEVPYNSAELVSRLVLLFGMLMIIGIIAGFFL